MNPATNLVLVGPMGAGKSCIGRCLGRALRPACWSMSIARSSSAPVPASTPSSNARAKPASARANAPCWPSCSPTTAWCSPPVAVRCSMPHNRRLLRERGFVVHLHVSVERQLERLARDRSRPLLARDDREQVLLTLAAERAPLYAQVADLRFDTDPYPAIEAATRLALELDIALATHRADPAAAQYGADMSTMRTVKVEGEARYDISIGPGLLDDASAARACAARAPCADRQRPQCRPAVCRARRGDAAQGASIAAAGPLRDAGRRAGEDAWRVSANAWRRWPRSARPAMRR